MPAISTGTNSVAGEVKSAHSVRQGKDIAFPGNVTDQ